MRARQPSVPKTIGGRVGVAGGSPGRSRSRSVDGTASPGPAPGSMAGYPCGRRGRDRSPSLDPRTERDAPAAPDARRHRAAAPDLHHRLAALGDDAAAHDPRLPSAHQLRRGDALPARAGADHRASTGGCSSRTASRATGGCERIARASTPASRRDVPGPPGQGALGREGPDVHAPPAASSTSCSPTRSTCTWCATATTWWPRSATAGAIARRPAPRAVSGRAT